MGSELATLVVIGTDCTIDIPVKSRNKLSLLMSLWAIPWFRKWTTPSKSWVSRRHLVCTSGLFSSKYCLSVKLYLKGKIRLSMNQWMCYNLSLVPYFIHRSQDWASNCCLTSSDQFLAISRQEQVAFSWDNGDVRFVLDQHS